MNIAKEIKKIIDKSDKLELETDLSEIDKLAISSWVLKIVIAAYTEGLKKGK